MFKAVNSKPDFFKLEEKILEFWKKNQTFEKSIKQRPESQAYSFYDGPPFVTGSPHYGTLLSSIAKDLVPRFWTMKGKRIRRVWGWDCHGLPIENKVENKLGLKNRKDIEKVGIKKFIEECRNYVATASPEWQWYVDHIGRWVNFKNSYKTMDRDYMETVIWVFKQIYDKGLIYKGKRVSLFCPRCSTPVSNFEIAMDNSYEMMEDPAITIKFAVLKDKKSQGLLSKLPKNTNLFILAWTTTPWTLPSNSALAIDEKEDYWVVKGSEAKNLYILAKERVKDVFGKNPYQKVLQLKGKELRGLSYKPLYEFFENPKDKDNFKVFATDFVSMEEGTGVVHMAPGFGEEDTEAGKKHNLSMFEAVDDEGKFIDKVETWAGLKVKKADPEIIADLRKRGLLFKEEKIVHSYPYCWRCKTPLIYKAQSSWFINVQKLKKLLLETNENINWVPEHFKHGRFALGIKEAPDWCISRTRYWATPMPIWQCPCGERKVVGSIAEIEKLSGKKVKDLHRPYIDEFVFKCSKCGAKMTRVKEVLDCWMESGSMPYGERHYPFKNKKEFEESFPADFISEYVAQTRAWFYVMHVVSNALLKTHCFKNVVVTGVIMGSDGRKMSKSFKNYPDPRKTLEKYGGDALRFYLMESQLLSAENINVSEGGIRDSIKTLLLPLWNCYKYFITYANLANFKPIDKKPNTGEILDQWILARLKEFILEIDKNLSAYLVPQAVRLIVPFINELSTWYIRRARERFVKGDKKALETLYFVLKEFVKAIAPVVPFISEAIYLNLKLDGEKESVHLCDYPKMDSLNEKEKKSLGDMTILEGLINIGRSQRKSLGIRVRQPLGEIELQMPKPLGDDYLKLIREELNVKKVVIRKGKGVKVTSFDERITPELREEGEARELVRKIQEARKKAGCKLDERIIVVLPAWPKKWENYLKERVLAKQLLKGKFAIKRG